MSEETPRTEQWSIYNRIKGLRRSRGLSQKEMAQELDLGQRSIDYFEHQGVEPNLRMAWRIADYFRLNLEDVFYRAQYSPAHEDEPGSEAPPPEPSNEISDRLQQRLQAQGVLNALLDLGGASEEELERRTCLDASVLNYEISILKNFGLIEESVQPGPTFGRPHQPAFELTDEGQHQIVEFHRNQQSY